MGEDRSPRETGRTPDAPPTPGVYCVIAGGGTGGHLLPGLAVARELSSRGHQADSMAFVTSEREIDAKLLAGTPYLQIALPGRGIQRRLTLQNLRAVWGLFVAQWRAVRLLHRLRPASVLAVGGYASLTCAVAAVLLRIPLVVAEQNARAGLANKVVARFARVSAVPFESTDLPGAVVTGNPVRAEVLAVDRRRDRDAAREQLGLPLDRTVVLGFAGSLGARRINESMAGLVDRWESRGDLAFRHVTGSQEGVAQSAATGLEADRIMYQVVPYEEQMDRALAAADVAVCRAGGTTVAELSVVGLPSVLVPLPIATRDHQTANATELVEAGGAVLVPDSELDTDRLEVELAAIIDVPERLESMSTAAEALGRRHAGARVADLVEECAR